VSLAGGWLAGASFGAKSRKAPRLISQPTAIDGWHPTTAQATTDFAKPMPRAIAPPLTRESGRHQYLVARAAIASGNDTAAIRGLRQSIVTSPRAYFADDAMYLLILAEERIGDSVSTQTDARELLTRYPKSPFANSRTRRLAAQSLPPRGR
jgi:TolA-binding protein